MGRASLISICLAAVASPALAEKLQHVGTAGPQSAEYWIDLDSVKDATQAGKRFVEVFYWIKFPNAVEHREGGELTKYNRLKEAMIFDCERPAARVFGSSEAWLGDKKIGEKPTPPNAPFRDIPPTAQTHNAMWQLACSRP